MINNYNRQTLVNTLLNEGIETTKIALYLLANNQIPEKKDIDAGGYSPAIFGYEETRAFDSNQGTLPVEACRGVFALKNLEEGFFDVISASISYAQSNRYVATTVRGMSGFIIEHIASNLPVINITMKIIGDRYSKPNELLANMIDYFYLHREITIDNTEDIFIGEWTINNYAVNNLESSKNTYEIKLNCIKKYE